MILIILTIVTLLSLLLFSILITDIKKSNLTGKVYIKRVGNSYILMGEFLENDNYLFKVLNEKEKKLISLQKYSLFKKYFKQKYL